MSTVTAIQGVDEILYALSSAAVSGLSPKPDITVGPLDVEEPALRLNWFLYRVSPDPTYRNMEPPNTGWRTARGNPPLALRLSYLLSAFPAAKTVGGDQEQFAHVGLAAVMQAVYENAVVGDGSPVLTPALIASAEATAGLFDEQPYLSPQWIGLLAAFDAIFLTVTWLFGEYLLEE